MKISTLNINHENPYDCLNDLLNYADEHCGLFREAPWEELEIVSEGATKKKFKMMVDHLRHECSNCHSMIKELKTVLTAVVNSTHQDDLWFNQAKFEIMRRCKLLVHADIRRVYPQLSDACDEADESQEDFAGEFLIKYGKHKGSKVKELESGT